MAYRRKTETKTIIGALIWIFLTAGAALSLRGSSGESSLWQRLGGYFGKQRRTVEVVSNEYQMLGFGDPVFVLSEKEKPIRVGNVVWIDFGDGGKKYRLGDTKSATLTLYGNAPSLEPGDYMMVHESDQSVEWVVRTMMTPRMRERIGTLITDAWASNQDELVKMFRPLIEDSIADASKVLKEDLAVAIEAHRDEIDRLSQRYQEQLLKKKIVPLVRNEIWPIVQQEGQPLVETIGKEIWAEVSVWRFGWRYLYDRSPLPEKKLTEKEFNRFVERKAVPILESHLEDFIDVQKAMLTRISQNETVKRTLSNSFREISNDPEFRDLVVTVVKEVLVDNQRLRDSLKRRWQSPAAKYAMARANQKLDPTIREIGKTLFGSTDTAITPEFAKVLRNKVLHKDERWLTLHSKAIGNRDEARAKEIAALPDKGESGSRQQLPMFYAFEPSEYPGASAPPIEASVEQATGK